MTKPKTQDVNPVPMPEVKPGPTQDRVKELETALLAELRWREKMAAKALRKLLRRYRVSLRVGHDGQMQVVAVG